MIQDTFFCHLDSSTMAAFINSAKHSVVYAGPGLQMLIAQAMIDVSDRLGTEMITVNLDVDEHVFRMGYGELEAVTALDHAGIKINHSPRLRNGLLLVDDIDTVIDKGTR